MKRLMQMALVASCVGFTVQKALAGAAALPVTPKSVIYFGWDTLGALTEDIYRNREKFAATGFDGIAMPVNGLDAKGNEYLGRLVLKGAWRYEDFASVIPKLREMTRLEGLGKSFAMVYLMSSPRMKWDDDAAWTQAAANFAILGRVAREGGLKGFFIDHEDYTGKPLFTWRAGDPDYAATRALARQRGRELFEALAQTFPDAVIINDRVLAQHDPALWSQTPVEAAWTLRDLWYSFVNGAIEALPPTMRFMDGCESTYGAKDDNGYRSRGYTARNEGLVFIEPALRTKYLAQSGLCFAKWLDSCTKTNAQGQAWLSETLFAAGARTADYYWAYGERHPIIDWGRKVHPRVSNTPWMTVVPELPSLLRASVGDYGDVRARAVRGELENLVGNSACDGTDASVPSPFETYTDLKDRPQSLFVRDAAVGCAKPGSLRLGGAGNFTFTRGVVKPGDRVYVHLAAKGAEPYANVVWRKGGAWKWYTEYATLVKPCGTTADGWKTFEVCLVAPEGVDGIGLVLGGRDVTPESPCWFDDIGIYRW